MKGQFFHSYLAAYLFWFQISIGCLALLLIHGLVGGAWGLLIRRVLKGGIATLPLMAVLFVPIMAAPAVLYPWARHGGDAYLNIPFFEIRAILYFALWLGMSCRLLRLPAGRPWDGESGIGLVILALTLTFAAIDWVMSLEPRWYSTIYGILFGIGSLLAALSFSVALLPPEVLLEVPVKALHDLGNLLLAFLMLWAYMAFMQYLIIWSGNLPEEISWFLHRRGPGWTGVATALAIGHFFGPFLVLLFREVKRHRPSLAAVGGCILFWRWVFMFWLVMPAFHPGRFHLHWLDMVAPVALGGLWMGVFLRHLRKQEAVSDGV